MEYNSGKKNSRTLKIDFITLAQCSFVPYTYNEGARPSIDELELPLSDIYFNQSNYSFELRNHFFSFQQMSLKGSSSSSLEGLAPSFRKDYIRLLKEGAKM